MARQLATIQYVRAASCLAIVINHATIHFHRVVHMGSARVAVFFIMSGFVLWLITAGRANDPGLFLARRLVRIIPLYWIVTILVFMKEIAGFSTHATSTPYDFILSLVFVPHYNGSGQLFPVLVPGWTLVFEIFFYISFAFLLILQERRRIIAATVLFGGLSAIGYIFHPTNPALATYTSPILLDFLAGAWLARLWVADRMPRWVAAALLFLGVALSLPTFSTGARGVSDGLTCVLSLMIMAGALGLEPRQGRAIKWLKDIGDSSYSIYLWHLPLQGIAWALLGRTHGMSIWLQVTVSMAIVIPVGMASYRWIEKPLMDVGFGWLDHHWARWRPSNDLAAAAR